MSDVTGFVPGWLPQKQVLGGNYEDDWDEIPDGRGNNTLAAIAGAMRKQGASYHAILRALLAANRLFMDRDPMPGDMVEQIARSVSRYAPEPDIDIELEDEEPEVEAEAVVERTAQTIADEYLRDLFVQASTLDEPQPYEWLWHPYLPAGRLTMVEGDEGIGKGMYCVWLAVKTTTGKAFTKGGETREPRDVLWFSAEDDPQDDIQPRMIAAGYEKGTHAEVHFYDARQPQWEFPRDSAKLRLLLAVKQPGLVIMDPGRVQLGAPPGVEQSSNSESAMRPGMASLLHIAQDTDTTIVFVQHTNKRSDGTSRERSTGSGVLRQVARHVVTMEKIGTKRAMSVEKANHMEPTYNVASWTLEESGDSAEFVPGGKLPEYKNIDEWRDVVKKADGEIEVEISTLDAETHYATHDCGTIAPTVAQIAKDLGVDKDTATRLRAELESARLIVDNKWQGCAQ